MRASFHPSKSYMESLKGFFDSWTFANWKDRISFKDYAYSIE